MRTKYFRYKAENLLNVKHIVTVHDFTFFENFSSEEETHDFWELVYVDRGEVFFAWNGEESALKEGQIVFHKPDVVHRLRTEDTARVIIVSFDCKSAAMHYFENFEGELSEPLRRYVFELLEYGKRVFDVNASTPATKKMAILKNPPLGGLQILKNTLELFLITLLQTELQKGSDAAIFLPPQENSKNLTEEIKELLRQNVYSTITIENLAEKTYYSRSYLFREFKKREHCSPMAYYCRLKTEEAQRLLKNTDLSVTEISAKLCYDSPNYFSKQFKKSVGISPLAYRKKYR